MLKAIIIISISLVLLQSCGNKPQSNPDYDLNFTTYHSFIEHYESVYEGIHDKDTDDVIKAADDLLYIASAFKEHEYIYRIAQICGEIIDTNDIVHQQKLFHELNIQMNKLQTKSPYYDFVQLNSTENQQLWISTDKCTEPPY